MAGGWALEKLDVCGMERLGGRPEARTAELGLTRADCEPMSKAMLSVGDGGETGDEEESGRRTRGRPGKGKSQEKREWQWGRRQGKQESVGANF